MDHKNRQSIGKKLYSIKESYWIFYNGIRTMKYMFHAKKNNEISPKFIERIMLAVTEVNKCEICSYAHTKKALESGMSNNEIRNMLAGIIDDVPDDEVEGIMFAQHYADTRGNPTNESWERIVEIYGISKAKGILGSIRTIMIGNAYGIAWSSFLNRIRGNPDERSSLIYEISMILSSFLIPFCFIHALISDLLKKPIVNFKSLK
ncbi:carboxymuconolactone decarboxylase family protein [Methanobacterium sp. ACI-7]|uniref:carboxymuconolactone decarboxylase family protein n=1 Tax=unclassified Methanobacterium TaxID=2627676 RepID=UPI0039C4DAD3